MFIIQFNLLDPTDGGFALSWKGVGVNFIDELTAKAVVSDLYMQDTYQTAYIRIIKYFGDNFEVIKDYFPLVTKKSFITNTVAEEDESMAEIEEVVYENT